MIKACHKEVLKASTFKGAELSASDAKHDDRDNGSSFSSKDLNFRGQTTDNLKEIVQQKLEFKRSRIMNDFKNEMTTYRDFTACDVPKFNRALDLIASTRWLAAVEASTRWLAAVECAFRIINYKEKNKVNVFSNFLRDSAKMWWEGKVCEKGKEWIGACTWKEFKELFNSEFALAEEINRNSRRIPNPYANYIFMINLIPIMLGVFEIVIGWDWLKKYDANILCSQKLVRVVNPQDTSFEKKGVEDVLIVNEFLDVFPEDLLGIKVDLAKIEVVMNWQAPKNVGEIRSLFGLAGYYRKFIQDFSKIASSLTKLTRKNTPFEWGGEQEEAFTTL
nr:hypothetical protein [Tanacetum cinerariifolium]